MKLFDQLRALARDKADRNGDGKVNLQDVLYAFDHAEVNARTRFAMGFVAGVIFTGVAVAVARAVA